MPFSIIRNDITKVSADAIVNTANPEPICAGGTDQAIYEAAGREALLAERRKIGRIHPGEAAVTPAFAVRSPSISASQSAVPAARHFQSSTPSITVSASTRPSAKTAGSGNAPPASRMHRQQQMILL